MSSAKPTDLDRPDRRMTAFPIERVRSSPAPVSTIIPPLDRGRSGSICLSTSSGFLGASHSCSVTPSSSPRDISPTTPRAIIPAKVIEERFRSSQELRTSHGESPRSTGRLSKSQTTMSRGESPRDDTPSRSRSETESSVPNLPSIFARPNIVRTNSKLGLR